MNRLMRELTVLVAAFGVAAVFGWALGKGLGSNNEVAAGGGAINNVIAITGNDNNRLYLIDTDNEVILVYEMPGGRTGFTMVAGRYYNFDRQLARIKDLPYVSRGYSLIQVKQRYEALQGR